MSVLDSPSVPGTRWDDEAPTVTLAFAEPSGRHARREPLVRRPIDVAAGHRTGPPTPYGVGPRGLDLLAGPRSARPGTPFSASPAGLPGTLEPGGRTWRARLAEAAGPAALEQIPGPMRRHPMIVAAAVVGFVVLALVLIVSAAIPSAITVQGSLLHTDSSSPLRAGTSCQTGLLHAGTPIEITDASGAVLGSGTLDSGIAMVDSGSLYGREGYATACAFSFTVDGVPAGQSSYHVEIAGVPNHLSFSEQELRDGPGLHNGS
jgi:hypothetical protein